MFKLTSTSNNTLSFQVVEGGKMRAVRLSPQAFCFTEALTDQIRNLQSLRVLRVKETAKSTPPKAAAAQAQGATQKTTKK